MSEAFGKWTFSEDINDIRISRFIVEALQHRAVAKHTIWPSKINQQALVDKDIDYKYQNQVYSDRYGDIQASS